MAIQWIDRVYQRVAALLPLRLRYWVVLGLWADATTGPWSDRHPDTVRVTDLLDLADGEWHDPVVSLSADRVE